jgi:predicted HAD superfamily Cof-like phosphohydrolase
MAQKESLLAEDFCRSVHQMMVAYEQTPKRSWPAFRRLVEVSEPNSTTKILRSDLLWEEFEEFLSASRKGDLVEVADALGDMMVIIAGTAVSYGIDLPAVLAEIQRSNMAKIDPETGKLKKRDDGKVLKPEGWKPPEVARVM